jgi:hypothetical protein
MATHAEHRLHDGKSFHYARIKSFIFSGIVFKNRCERPEARMPTIITQIVIVIHQD